MADVTPVETDLDLKVFHVKSSDVYFIIVDSGCPITLIGKPMSKKYFATYGLDEENLEATRTINNLLLVKADMNHFIMWRFQLK